MPLLSSTGWAVRFWKRRLSDINTKRRHIIFSEKYREKAAIDQSLASMSNPTTIKIHLRKATKKLRKAQKNAQKIREKFMDALVTQAAEEADKDKAVILKKIRNTEKAHRTT